MKKTILSAVIAASAALAGQNVLAHSITHTQVTPGYVGNSGGFVTANSSGDCLRTSSWNSGIATESCDSGMKPKQVAKAAPAAAPAPKPAPSIEKMTLREDALFDVGKYELRPKGRAELDALAAKLKSRSITLEQVSVTGHASATGPADFNQILSELRADAVKTYLVQQGIDPVRIVTRGMGESQPIASNATAEGRALNRRVEIEIRAQQTTMSSN